MAEIGETMLGKGKLEQVTDKKSKRKYHRMGSGVAGRKGYRMREAIVAKALSVR